MTAPQAGAWKNGRVWDPFVRLFHWSLVAAFATAWYGLGEAVIHETAGQIVLILIIARLAWGIIGPGTARFETFVRGPMTTLRYVASIPGGKPKHHLGHNPAGAAMILMLLATLAVTTTSGILMSTTALWGNGAIEYVHGTSAYLMLFLIAGHLLGVLVAALQHRENLPLAMLTGWKRVPEFTRPYLGGMRLGWRRLAAAVAIITTFALIWTAGTAALNASIWRLHKSIAAEAKTAGCEVETVEGPDVTIYPHFTASYSLHVRRAGQPLPVSVSIHTALQRRPALDLAALNSTCAAIAAHAFRLRSHSTSALSLAMRSSPPPVMLLQVAAAAVGQDTASLPEAAKASVAAMPLRAAAASGQQAFKPAPVASKPAAVRNKQKKKRKRKGRQSR